jgi:GntR family histidine utilization transcriptional repressor
MNSISGNAAPLYEKVKTYVLDHIGSGEWSTDQRLPSENELVSTLGVSRMTVNRAMRELTSAGYLLRIQGVGTFVAPKKPLSTLIEVNNISSEIAARGSAHRAEVIRLETIKAPPAELIEAFEFSKPQPVGHSIVLHFENNVPVQIEERYVNAGLVPDYDRQDFSQMTTFDYLSVAIPLSEVEHVISAIPADKDMAHHLQLRIGEPCLLLHRRTWSGKIVATVNNFIYAGRRYSLGSRYAPASIKTGAGS